MKKNPELGIVFLMWVPYGIEHLVEFVHSYETYPPNVDHQLYILFNGTLDNNIEPYCQFLKSRNIEYKTSFLESGQDIYAYRHIAKQIKSKYLLFLNTYSRILAANWGKFFLSAIKQPNVGLVGATGSWQSRTSNGFKRMAYFLSPEQVAKNHVLNYSKKTIQIGKFSIGISPRLSLIGALIKSILDFSDFPRFPNPHLRTNAFIVEREFWLEMKINGLKSKKDAYRMESGKNSFTAQTIQKNKKVLVIDKKGTTYEYTEWNKSHTLWQFKQENLLISDNFTRLFEHGTENEQRIMTSTIWS
ncbi:hypothetical protein CLV98_101582 [Dyadobacter jejuensis]|uniref:Glycosyl transferase family 2 n=1 Tax=Dyadobacter jejuensis TaxID=1082580 RepID=A0A316ASA5_9BACT|nr:hypothetical protein [Dyadobacter jejuensis]PWJ60398.1 hypothetical protein CLV98_101582 [Dyadobacter jejuensis]